MTQTLLFNVIFDETMTDADSLAAAFDRLLETAMSTPGIMDDYGEVRIGPVLAVYGNDEEDLEQP